MKHVKTLNTKRLQNTVKKGGCGECQTSCQSACKTSCTVGNQSCEHKNSLKRNAMDRDVFGMRQKTVRYASGRLFVIKHLLFWML